MAGYGSDGRRQRRYLGLNRYAIPQGDENPECERMGRAAGRAMRPVDRCDGDGVISGDMRHESLVFGGERGGAGGDGP